MLNPDLSFFFKNTVDSDQLASDDAIWSESTLFLHADWKYLLKAGMLMQGNRIKIVEYIISVIQSC